VAATRPSFTAVVVTALSEEFDALEGRLRTDGAAFQAARTLPSGTILREFRLEGRQASWTVHLAEMGEGNNNAAAATQELLAAFGPDAALLVGIAGSLKADIVPGDVVVATKVYDIHGARESAEGSGARPEAIGASRPLEQTARHLESGIRISFKPIASGQVVLASPSSPLRAWLSATYQDAGAIEMEGYGFCLAARYNETAALVIRGISDNADGEKHRSDTNGDRERAAANAAEVAVAVLMEHQPGRPGGALTATGSTPVTAAGTGAPETTPPVITPPPVKPPTSTTSTRTRTRIHLDWRRIWRKNKKELTSVSALALAAVVTFGVIASCHSEGAPVTDAKTRSAGKLKKCPQAGGLELSIAASVDKSEPLRRAAQAYGKQTLGGNCVHIVVKDRNSARRCGRWPPTGRRPTDGSRMCGRRPGGRGSPWPVPPRKGRTRTCFRPPRRRSCRAR